MCFFTWEEKKEAPRSQEWKWVWVTFIIIIIIIILLLILEKGGNKEEEEEIRSVLVSTFSFFFNATTQF